jgi:prepilin-type N-terminal cleavage/methylation domain-containing protein
LHVRFDDWRVSLQQFGRPHGLLDIPAEHQYGQLAGGDHNSCRPNPKVVLHGFGLERIMKRSNVELNILTNARFRRNSQCGMTLIELMIAMTILAVGLGGLTNVLVLAMASDNRNSKDTSATLLAQMVVEQISAQHPNSNATISVTDCTGNAWAVASAGGPSPSGTGAALVTTSTAAGYGGIDQTQAYANIPASYAMKYVDCGGAGNIGTPTTYDVRWNVMTINANYTRLVTASVRPLNATSLGGQMFALPVNLRAVAGP